MEALLLCRESRRIETIWHGLPAGTAVQPKLHGRNRWLDSKKARGSARWPPWAIPKYLNESLLTLMKKSRGSSQSRHAPAT